MRLDKDRYIERGTINGVEWMRSHGPAPGGLVIVPPLIGGHALQQLRLLRPLVRRNLDLLSFNYAGHGASKGAFSFQAAVENSLMALGLAQKQSRREQIPLFGIASCFAAVPMLQAVFHNGEPLVKMVLINALPNLHWEKMAAAFYRYWRKNQPWHPTLKGLRAALQAYRDELLPDISHDDQAFGILSRRRVQWFKMIQDLFTIRRLEVQPLASTPVLCVYGLQDRLLPQIGYTNWNGYESLMESICPQIRFWRIEGDHFLRGMETRQRLISTMIRFFSTARADGR